MYLVEVDNQEREHEAILRIFDTESVIQAFFWELGIRWPLCWYLIEVKQRDLVSARRGDVDILAGNLAWREPERYRALVHEFAAQYSQWNPTWHHEMAMRKLVEDGGICWPPSVADVVAIEVKCAYLTENIVHSTKSSPSKTKKIRHQVDGLVKMGFARVALLDFIATPPSFETNTNAWLQASEVASFALKQMTGILQRLPDDIPASHFAASIGSVAGGNESSRGAAQLVRIRPNSSRIDSRQGRFTVEMQTNLAQMLASTPQPLAVPYNPITFDHSAPNTCI